MFPGRRAGELENGDATRTINGGLRTRRRSGAVTRGEAVERWTRVIAGAVRGGARVCAVSAVRPARSTRVPAMPTGMHPESPGRDPGRLVRRHRHGAPGRVTGRSPGSRRRGHGAHRNERADARWRPHAGAGPPLLPRPHVPADGPGRRPGPRPPPTLSRRATGRARSHAPPGEPRDPSDQRRSTSTLPVTPASTASWASAIWSRRKRCTGSSVRAPARRAVVIRWAAVSSSAGSAL